MFDPDLPIRGRYVSLQVEVSDSRSKEEVENKFQFEIANIEKQRAEYHGVGPYNFGHECGSLEVRNGAPVPAFDQHSLYWQCDNLSFERSNSSGEITLRVDDPIVFFLPDRAHDPTRLNKGEELWVLATIPRKGPPRPIALGIKRTGSAAISPLDLN